MIRTIRRFTSIKKACSKRPPIVWLTKNTKTATDIEKWKKKYHHQTAVHCRLVEHDDATTTVAEPQRIRNSSQLCHLYQK